VPCLVVACSVLGPLHGVKRCNVLLRLPMCCATQHCNHCRSAFRMQALNAFVRGMCMCSPAALTLQTCMVLLLASCSASSKQRAQLLRCTAEVYVYI
jgi:hypothetical protein